VISLRYKLQLDLKLIFRFEEGLMRLMAGRPGSREAWMPGSRDAGKQGCSGGQEAGIDESKKAF